MIIYTNWKPALKKAPWKPLLILQMKNTTQLSLHVSMTRKKYQEKSYNFGFGQGNFQLDVYFI